MRDNEDIILLLLFVFPVVLMAWVDNYHNCMRCQDRCTIIIFAASECHLIAAHDAAPVAIRAPTKHVTSRYYTSFCSLYIYPYVTVWIIQNMDQRNALFEICIPQIHTRRVHGSLNTYIRCYLLNSTLEKGKRDLGTYLL